MPNQLNSIFVELMFAFNVLMYKIKVSFRTNLIIDKEVVPNFQLLNKKYWNCGQLIVFGNFENPFE